MDIETFKKMLAEVLSDTKVQAKDEEGNPKGTPHPLALYLYRVRQNQIHAKHGASSYTDEQAVKAVKDKLS